MSNQNLHNRPPTIKDLRSKLCWICREEEVVNESSENMATSTPTSTLWVHPCSCTLIAHQACLLRWIEIKQETAAMVDDTLKCPQCGTPYLIVSYNPPALRFLDRLTYLMSRVARVGAIISISSIVIVAGTTVIIMSTVYAAYAIEQFAGRDAFLLLYGEDMTKWSMWAWVELPLIPVALLASNSTNSLNSFFLSAWISLAFPSSHIRKHSGPTWSWPPSPLFTFTIWPFLRITSQIIRRRLRKWVVENATATAVPITTTPTRLRPAADEGPFVLDIIQHGPEDGALPQHGRQQAPANPDREQPVVARPAERVITGGMIGRLIIGSLGRPFIANMMGNALLFLSKRSSWLRHLLGVHRRRPTIVRYANGAPWSIGLHSARTWTWDELDPVWWRNTIGLGLFEIGTNALDLWYLWLSEREKKSRRILDRDFEGVDLRNLDLLPNWDGSAVGRSDS